MVFGAMIQFCRFDKARALILLDAESECHFVCHASFPLNISASPFYSVSADRNWRERKAAVASICDMAQSSAAETPLYCHPSAAVSQHCRAHIPFGEVLAVPGENATCLRCINVQLSTAVDK
jgi:hypothetical protein